MDEKAERKNEWTPSSWQNKKALQQPVYRDDEGYRRVIGRLTSYPPLISPGEIDRLKRKIGEAGEGEGFILQGGDCVERFIDCNERTITNKFKIILQMSVILTYAARKPVIRIGRIAGQYSKPRSNETEVIKGVEIPVYRGDGINGYDPEKAKREPDSLRLLESFYHSAVTINYIRALIAGGFADLHRPFTWNLYEIEQTEKWPEYRDILEQILDAIRFMETFGGVNTDTLGSIEFYTSHEGLHLGYEEAMTRRDERLGRYLNCGAHMLWIGERTRHPDGAHVEYFRGVDNPIAIKIGPSIDKDEMTGLIGILNPKNEKGRITIITRLGRDRAGDVLPGLIAAVRKSRQSVTWSCDPMHGNTDITETGVKTRNFDNILGELKESYVIHRDRKSILSGVHFELTGDDVTECIGGAVDLTANDLSRNYQSYCDPRLNYAQSMEMAFLIAKLIKT
ncbi:MAG: 3-deoxy-7-phosphoheptulonate synthase [Spirochaetales bacterium]|nr:3-deoxy-7-phosphoheptulonate synthase [Spirochaetales bacterium]